MCNQAIVLALMLAYSTLAFAQQTTERHRMVDVRESNTRWEADIDTTNAHSLIHAERIAVSNGGPRMEKNVGSPMTFRLVNKAGEGRTVNSRVAGVVTLGGEQYYTVLLELGLNQGTEHIWKKVPVVLMNRTAEQYGLIMGRDYTTNTVTVKD